MEGSEHRSPLKQPAQPNPTEFQLNDSLKIFATNIRSAKGKTEELSADTHDYDVICLTETHLDHTIFDHQIFDYQNKIIFRKDRDVHGGRVLLAINDGISVEQMRLTLAAFHL